MSVLVKLNIMLGIALALQVKHLYDEYAWRKAARKVLEQHRQD
jgi:hypothetical protein